MDVVVMDLDDREWDKDWAVTVLSEAGGKHL